MKSYLHIIRKYIVIVLTLSLTACNLVTQEFNASGASSAMISPQPGAIYTLGDAIPLEAIARFPNRMSVESFTFYADAIFAGETTLTDSFSTTHAFSTIVEWTPEEAGEYMLQVNATLSNGDVEVSNPIRVCVLDISFDGIDARPPYGFSGPCEIPVSLLDPTATISMIADASPSSVGFGNSTCQSTPPTSISFHATVTDAAHRVAFVIVQYSMYDRGVNFSLALTPSSSSGADTIYTGSTEELDGLLGGNPADGIPPSGGIVWTARAYNGAGSVILTDGPHTIPAAPCIAPEVPTPRPLIIAPTDTIVPAQPASTETLVPSESTCPPGTYFAPGKKVCVAIEIQPTQKNGGDGGESNSCTPPPAGCPFGESWDTKTCKCHQ